jgi:hypothetical protein
MSSVSATMTASVKSSVTSHHDERNSSRRGTTQPPVRRTEPPRWSIRTTSSACAATAPGRPGPATRSAVSAASSPSVRADRAASTRSSNSSAVSRPSARAPRSTSMTRSRSASDARTSGKSADTFFPCLRTPHPVSQRYIPRRSPGQAQVPGRSGRDGHSTKPTRHLLSAPGRCGHDTGTGTLAPIQVHATTASTRGA